MLGMRSTLWLSALAVPFSYGTTILLARTGPEAIGQYGLLGAYVAFVSGMLYLGGDAVPMKFLPELDAGDRLPFVLSYYVVICLGLIPWFIVAAFRPVTLHYLFGRDTTTSFQQWILYFSPICILGLLLISALKGQLDIAPAQAITRFQAVGYFLVYLTFFLVSRSFVTQHYAILVWGIYFGLAVIAVFMGMRVLMRSLQGHVGRNSFRPCLPRGFWKYTFSLQQLSFVGFLSRRLDVLLVLNLAGLATLGKYVAIISLADPIRILNGYVIDTLLPSLTNMLAANNHRGASEVFRLHMRILFLVNAAVTFIAVFLARPLLHIYGKQYLPEAGLVIVLSLLMGISIPLGISGILLSSVGQQQKAVWAGVVQLGLFVFLFYLFWREWHLLGAVLAYGISLFACRPPLMLIAAHHMPFKLHFTKDYTMFFIVALAAGTFLYFHSPLGIGSGILAWSLAMATFMMLARYSLSECRKLLKCFIPF